MRIMWLVSALPLLIFTQVAWGQVPSVSQQAPTGMPQWPGLRLGAGARMSNAKSHSSSMSNSHEGMRLAGGAGIGLGGMMGKMPPGADLFPGQNPFLKMMAAGGDGVAGIPDMTGSPPRAPALPGGPLSALFRLPGTSAAGMDPFRMGVPMMVPMLWG